MPLEYIPVKKKRSGAPATGGYAELPLYQKRDISNQKDIEELAASGQLADFIKYQNRNTLWDNIKRVGSGALDILQRGEYGAVAAAQAMGRGENPVTAAGREVFSGIGGIQGQKKTYGEAARETFPSYDRFSQEHPIAAIGTDLAMSIAGDPTTFIPARAVGKAGAGVARGIGKVAKKVVPDAVQDVIGKTFNAGYRWQKAGAPEGYDIIWQEGKFADALMRRYGKEIEPVTQWLRKSATPDQVQEFIRAAKGDIVASDPVVAGMVKRSGDTFRRMGRRDYRYLGKAPEEKMMQNYLPNRPNEYTDLMTTAGERSRTGYGKPGGFKKFKSPFEKEQVLRSGDELIQWMTEKGVAPEQMGEAVSRSMGRRAYESMAKARVVRTQTRLVNELPDVFRKLKPGTNVPWDKQIQPGEALWMPAGNLKFFAKEVIGADEFNKIADKVNALGENGFFILPETLDELTKTVPMISSKVQVYAVPAEIAEDLNKMSNRLGSDTVVDWWDKVLSTFKNTAILSPGFHLRNFISSGAQNYLADVAPASYGRAFSILNGKDNATVIAGKSVGGWRNLMDRFGITGGSFIGQQTGEATGKFGRVAEPVFKANRAVGTTVENTHRAALFIDRVSKGASPEEAAKAVKKFHFNYSELTDFERGVARRFIPFYSWMRNNVPLQLEMLVKAPQKFRNIAKLKDAVSGGVTSEFQPDWWKDQDVWETRFEDSQGQRQAVSVGLPYADLNQLGRSSVGMMGPFATLYNLASNYDPFFDQKISEYPGQTKPLLTIGDKQVNVPSQVEYVISGMIPIAKRYGIDLSKELSQIVTRTQEPGTMSKALSKFIGVRVMPLVREKEDKQRVYQLRRDLMDFARYQEQKGRR